MILHSFLPFYLVLSSSMPKKSQNIASKSRIIRSDCPPFTLLWPYVPDIVDFGIWQKVINLFSRLFQLEFKLKNKASFLEGSGPVLSGKEGGRVPQVPGSNRPRQGALLGVILPDYKHFLCRLILQNVTSRLPAQWLPALSAEVGLEVGDHCLKMVVALHHLLMVAATLGRSSSLNVCTHLHIDLLYLSA